jgi:hypothetical protein
MQETKETRTPAEERELIDVLIAISVVSKRLARKLEIQMEEDNHGQNERTVDDAR